MATQWISPTWRMPDEQNQSKFENYSLDFNGNADYISLDNTSTLSFADNFSISMWINPSSLSGFQMLFSGSGYSGGTGIGHYIYDDTVRTYVSVSGSATQIFQSSALLNIGDWTHVIIQREKGTKWEMWINGVLNQSNSVSNLTDDLTSASSTIARHYNNPNYNFNGEIGQTTIYDFALTSAQITALYNSGTPINPMAISGNPPIAYYPLGGSSTGSSSTLTTPNESVPSATVFQSDGSSGPVINLPSINLGTTNTVSFWYYNETQDTSQIPIGSSTNQFDYLISISTGYPISVNRIYYAIGNPQSALDFNNTEARNILNNSNTWIHIAITRNGDSVSLYLNGDFNQTLTGVGTTNDTILDTLIAEADGVGSSSINGKMSNVSVFDTALPATGTESVESLYNYGTPPNISSYSNLKAWYKLNVDTSTWFDKINNVTPLNEWWVGNSNSNYPTSAKFLGTSDQANYSSLVLPSMVDLGSDNWGISFWFNVDMYLPNAPRNIMGGSGIFQYLSIFGNGGLYAYIQANWTLISGGFVADKQWHHCVITNEAGSPGTLKVYIDDNLTYTNTAGSAGLLPAKFYSIGTYGGGTTRPYGGFVSNVSLFNTNLDASAVTTLYNNGTPEVTPSNSPTNWWKLDNLTTGIQDAIGSGGTFTNTNTIVGKIPVAKNTGLSSGMTTANLVNSDLTRSIPYSSYSMTFDAAGTDRINIGNPSNLQITNSFSVSIWIKQTTQQDSVVISKDAFGTNRCWSLWTNAYQSNNFVQFIVWDASNAIFYVDSNIRVDDGNWHHLTAVYDASNSLKIYIDGVLNNTNSTNIPSAIADKTVDIILGESNTSGSFEFPGNISNAAIFNSAITEDQVLSIYNGGVPNDISSLSPVSWWSLAGDSYYDGTNWICPDLGGGGNNGTSANLAATALVGNGPGGSANGIATSMNIPENLQGNAPNSSKNAFSVNMNPADRVEDVAPTP